MHYNLEASHMEMMMEIPKNMNRDTNKIEEKFMIPYKVLSQHLPSGMEISITSVTLELDARIAEKSSAVRICF
jgi:hypothetical protein